MIAFPEKLFFKRRNIDNGDNGDYIFNKPDSKTMTDKINSTDSINSTKSEVINNL